jgi:hypothetical protein
MWTIHKIHHDIHKIHHKPTHTYTSGQEATHSTRFQKLNKKGKPQCERKPVCNLAALFFMHPTKVSGQRRDKR